MFVASQESPFIAYVTHVKVDGSARNTLCIQSVDELSEAPQEISTSCSSNSSLYAIATHSDLLAWAEQDNLVVLHCSKPRAVQRIRCRTKSTSVAVHPTSELVAVGDVDGAIHIHTAPFGQARMKLHWHTLAVADLHLSAGFLYSVGSEGVLVRWDLESEDRQFLPRLGLPMKFVSVAHNEKYAVCSHCDNSKWVRLSTASINPTTGRDATICPPLAPRGLFPRVIVAHCLIRLLISLCRCSLDGRRCAKHRAPGPAGLDSAQLLGRQPLGTRSFIRSRQGQPRGFGTAGTAAVLRP